MDRVSARELRTTARVADGLVYIAGAAGVVAGALLFRDGDIPFAVVAWVLTFIAGAVLRLAAACARALAELLVTAEGIRTDIDDLRLERPAAPPHGEGGSDRPRAPDPWRRWGGWH